jgi:hypothetical protein
MNTGSFFSDLELRPMTQLTKREQLAAMRVINPDCSRLAIQPAFLKLSAIIFHDFRQTARFAHRR